LTCFFFLLSWGDVLRKPLKLPQIFNEEKPQAVLEVTAMGKGEFIVVMAVGHFHSLFKICKLKYWQTKHSDPAPHDPFPA
jgi:hypothetical protein